MAKDNIIKVDIRRLINTDPDDFSDYVTSHSFNDSLQYVKGINDGIENYCRRNEIGEELEKDMYGIYCVYKLYLEKEMSEDEVALWSRDLTFLMKVGQHFSDVQRVGFKIEMEGMLSDSENELCDKVYEKLQMLRDGYCIWFFPSDKYACVNQDNYYFLVKGKNDDELLLAIKTVFAFGGFIAFSDHQINDGGKTKISGISIDTEADYGYGIRCLSDEEMNTILSEGVLLGTHVTGIYNVGFNSFYPKTKHLSALLNAETEKYFKYIVHSPETLMRSGLKKGEDIRLLIKDLNDFYKQARKDREITNNMLIGIGGVYRYLDVYHKDVLASEEGLDVIKVGKHVVNLDENEFDSYANIVFEGLCDKR